MKKILFFILISSLFSAQTQRFIYNLDIHKKKDSVQTEMFLDITKDEIKFYDAEFAKNDSIRKQSGQLLQYFSPSDQSLIRKRGTNENQMFYSFGYDYFVISSIDKMDWKLEPETKTFQDITLQKATTNFGGRNWTAWFAKDIPFQEGPYKFRGLSGLIFEIYDSENAFHYTLTEIKKLAQKNDTEYFVETRYGKKPLAISQKKYNDIKLNYYNNVVKEMSDFVDKGGSIGSKLDLETKEKINEQKKAIQQSIRNAYFPIELDKAVHYPVK